MCRISDLLVIKHWAENCSVFVGHVIEHTILRGTSKKMKRWHEWAFSCSSSHFLFFKKNSLCNFFHFSPVIPGGYQLDTHQVSQDFFEGPQCYILGDTLRAGCSLNGRSSALP
jgi:hypothetical protein